MTLTELLAKYDDETTRQIAAMKRDGADEDGIAFFTDCREDDRVCLIKMMNEKIALLESRMRFGSDNVIPLRSFVK